MHLYICLTRSSQSMVVTLGPGHIPRIQLCLSPRRAGCLRRQAVVSFTWDSAGRTLSYPHEEFMAECSGLSDHLAALIRRLLHIKLVTVLSFTCADKTRLMRLELPL